MKLSFPNQTFRTAVLDIIFSVLGSFVVAVALVIFTIPNDIAPGGVSGLSTALAHISNIRIGFWMLILNVPLLVLSLRMMGLRAFLMTLFSTACLALFTELFAFLPPYTGDVLLASVFGGAIAGAGIGLLFLRGISTGGTDLLALLLRKPFPNLPSGTLLLFADAAVVIVATAVFGDIHVALYSVVTIFCCSKVIDALAQGVDHAKVIFTVTERGGAVTAALRQHTERGSTILPAYGGFTGGDKQVVITVTRRNKLAQTLGIIKHADPKAFTFVTDSTEVHGEGFKT